MTVIQNQPTSNTTPTPAATRKKANPLGLDWALLLVVGVLIAFGLMMVYSTTFDWSYREFDSPTTIFFKQVRSLAIGLVVMFLMARIDYHIWKPFAVPLLGVTILALIAVLFFGASTFGSVRGLLNGSYQPSEVAKLIIILYLAVRQSSKKERINDIPYRGIP